MKLLWIFLRNPLNLVMLVAALVAYVAAIWFELFENLYEVSRGYEDLEPDEVLSVLLVGSLTFPFFLLRWNSLLVEAHQQMSEAEAEARRHALHDPLTGLPNRRSLHLRVKEAASGPQPAHDGRALTILLLDLDRFKPVNDLHGHHAGDLLLCEVARRLRRVCPEDALVVRLGGDEFVVALTTGDADDHGNRLARRIMEAMSAPFAFDDWSATISCSIGIADWSEGMAPSDLLRNADQAMYRAKQAGRGCYAHYDETLGKTLREQAVLEQDLRRALAEGAITPHFQPIYDITSHQLRGFEVLARWSDAVRGFVPPDVFIDLAEELGLIEPLSEMVLNKACAALAGWPTDLPISFNLSPRQFSDLALPGRILSVLERHGIPGSRLEIEITERTVLADPIIARRIIADLAAAGVRISLDDFGKGMSSLATLTELPFNKLKIDRSFITDVDLLPQKGKIVAGVLALAESLGLDVTAEGIEREEELAFLKDRSCSLGQGYLLGRPQPAESIERLLADQSARVVVPLRVVG